MDDREGRSVVDGEVSDVVEAAVTRTRDDEGEREDGLVVF